MTTRFEIISRRAVAVPGRPIDQSLQPRRRPPGASGDATLRWGAPSDFQFASTTGGGITQPIYTVLPTGDEGEPDEADGLLFTETGRVTSTVRVTNPSDAGQFVDVERIERISFRGPDGRVRTFVLINNPA